MKIDKSVLGIAGEFAVATELCRRNIYAQLTLGNQKRVDLLTMSRDGVFLKVEVKAKQSASWGHIKGLSSGEAFLVFVDFAKRNDTDRPDFFVLNAADWLAVATRYVEHYRARHADRSAHLDEEICPVHPDEKDARGKPFRGCTIRVADIEPHREKWSKITQACVRVTEAQTPDATRKDQD